MVSQGVMKDVKLIAGQGEASAMDALKPIVREREDQEPNQQYSIIDDRTPKKKVASDFNAHLLLPSTSQRHGSKLRPPRAASASLPC
jgi:hypothetical protein